LGTLEEFRDVKWRRAVYAYCGLKHIYTYVHVNIYVQIKKTLGQ
jgi:hypothetical protein